MDFPGGSEGKESACSAGDLSSIPELGRSPGESSGYPLQYSCLENPMDGGVWLPMNSPLGHKDSHMTERLTHKTMGGFLLLFCFIIGQFFGCFYIINHIIYEQKWKWKSLSRFWLSTTPWTITVLGILQARTLEWVAFPFSRGSSQPRDRIQVSHIAGGFFTLWATREGCISSFPICVPFISFFCIVVIARIFSVILNRGDIFVLFPILGYKDPFSHH